MQEQGEWMSGRVNRNVEVTWAGPEAASGVRLEPGVRLGRDVRLWHRPEGTEGRRDGGAARRLDARGVMMPPKKLYRIGEVMRYTNLSRQTLHNYTVMGLIREEERGESSNHRYYGEEVFERVRRIQEMKKQDMRLQEIKERLDAEDAAAADAAGAAGTKQGEA